MKFNLSFLKIFVISFTIEKLQLTSFTNVKRQKLAISIIVPKDAFRERAINTCIANEMKTILTSNYTFLNNFSLDGYGKDYLKS